MNGSYQSRIYDIASKTKLLIFLDVINSDTKTYDIDTKISNLDIRIVVKFALNGRVSLYFDEQNFQI